MKPKRLPATAEAPAIDAQASVEVIPADARERAQARLKELQKPLPAGFRFSRDEAQR